MTTQRPARKSKGWVPDQHGAWFMVTVPVLTGVILAPAWIQIPLVLTWWLGYFTFFAASVWMRSRFKPINRKPVLVYGSLTAVFGVITLILQWNLLVWAPAYIPLVAIAVWETYKRRPRSLLSGEATVIAACLMLPVSAWAGARLDGGVWAACAVYLAFYAGSVPYVKTLIRNRGSRPWLIGSVAYHCVMLIAAIVAVIAGWHLHWFAIVVAVVLAVRAWAMPVSGQRRAKPWRPKQVGRLDSVISIAVIAAALLSGA